MNREVKVVLLGDSGVGKSSIVLRFCSDIFKVTHESTLGAAFMARTIEVNGINFKFQIWDTAGQEKYKSLTPLYYREAQVALIVYDITHKDSFDVLKSWVNELKAHGPKKIVQVLVGNKNDLIEDEKVSYDEANNYAQQIGASLKLTSCKENKGIQELFVSIAEQILYEEQNKIVEGKKPEKPQNPSVRVTTDDQNKKKKKEGGCC
ncbi:unnamed protein product [Paramecium primaurelia]|uniref:Uncharacterized protein n=2 Tax=Paramecium TaxID=5884 RepID=A0A8S1XD95_9CILI|nr:unnamed protein product [Paramecium primaurelia]CAD8198935.1 unnamed protein product [Paramecium pentaurelia]